MGSLGGSLKAILSALTYLHWCSAHAKGGQPCKGPRISGKGEILVPNFSANPLPAWSPEADYPDELREYSKLPVVTVFFTLDLLPSHMTG